MKNNFFSNAILTAASMVFILLVLRKYRKQQAKQQAEEEISFEGCGMPDDYGYGYS